MNTAIGGKRTWPDGGGAPDDTRVRPPVALLVEAGQTLRLKNQKPKLKQGERHYGKLDNDYNRT